jgi:hypothetical protein
MSMLVPALIASINKRYEKFEGTPLVIFRHGRFGGNLPSAVSTMPGANFTEKHTSLGQD